jgi:hypothetical protein
MSRRYASRTVRSHARPNKLSSKSENNFGKPT